jgi:hypothetical protein
MVDVRGPLSNSEPKTAALDFAARRVGTIKAIEDVRKISFSDAGVRHFNDGCAVVLSKPSSMRPDSGVYFMALSSKIQSIRLRLGV